MNKSCCAVLNAEEIIPNLKKKDITLNFIDCSQQSEPIYEGIQVHNVSYEFGWICLSGVIYFSVSAFSALACLNRWTQLLSCLLAPIIFCGGLAWLIASSYFTYRPWGRACSTTEVIEYDEVGAFLYTVLIPLWVYPILLCPLMSCYSCWLLKRIAEEASR